MVPTKTNCNKTQSVMQTSDLIIDNLYLGPISSAKNEKDLRSKNITHILSVMQKPLHEAVLHNRYHKNVPAEDTTSCNITPVFQESFDFIDQARDAGTGILVHCQAGVSRSATVVIAYLMYKYNLSYKRAREKVKSCRPVICPNKAFDDQLQRFEFMRQRIKPRHIKKEKTTTVNEDKEVDSASSQLQEFPEQQMMQLTVSSDAECVYKCRRCRAKLFEGKDLVLHNTGEGEAAFDWRSKIPANKRPRNNKHDQTECKLSIFLEELPWIAIDGSEAGKILCPRCGVKIGSYVWHGEKCPCGSWVAPAFHIDSKKVDNFPSPLPSEQMTKMDEAATTTDVSASLAVNSSELGACGGLYED